MTKQNPTIVGPKNGWKAHTYYTAEVSFDPANPCFGAVFYSGFLNGPGGTPGGYNFVCAIGLCPKEGWSIRDLVFIRVIRELCDDEELRNVDNKWKLPGVHDDDPFDLTPIDTNQARPSAIPHEKNPD